MAFRSAFRSAFRAAFGLDDSGGDSDGGWESTPETELLVDDGSGGSQTLLVSEGPLTVT